MKLIIKIRFVCVFLLFFSSFPLLSQLITANDPLDIPVSSPSTNTEPPNPTEFLRLTDTALQTAVYTLSNEDSSVRIKLIGVIHVGEVRYYREIMKMVKDVDYLYYEGIRLNHANLPSEGYLSSLQTEEKSGKKGVENIANFQNEIARYFNLVEQADYLKPQKNWVNADVNLKQFMEILRKSNLNLEQLSRNLKLDSKVALENDSEETENLTNESDKSILILKYKKKMAKYLINSAKELCYDDGMKIPREAIIIERNKVAINFFKDKLQSENPHELGVIYGAAHLPHFIEVLQKEHKFQILNIEWLDAWSLKSN